MAKIAAKINKKSKPQSDKAAAAAKKKVKDALKAGGIKLFDPSDMKKKGRSGENYSKYSKAIDDFRLIEWIDNNMEKRKEPFVIMRIRDWATLLDMQMRNTDSPTLYDDGKEPQSIFWGSKFALFIAGLFVADQGTSKEDDKLIIIQRADPGLDIEQLIHMLPLSLRDKLSEDDINQIKDVKFRRMEEEAARAEIAAKKAEEEAAAAKKAEEDAKSGAPAEPGSPEAAPEQTSEQ